MVPATFLPSKPKAEATAFSGILSSYLFFLETATSLDGLKDPQSTANNWFKYGIVCSAKKLPTCCGLLVAHGCKKSTFFEQIRHIEEKALFYNYYKCLVLKTWRRRIKTKSQLATLLFVL